MSPDSLSSSHPILAEISAYQAGQISVYVVVALVVVIVFILSLVRLIVTKNARWVIGLVLSAIVGLGGLGAGTVLLAKKAKEASETPRVVASADQSVHARIPGHWKEMPNLNEVATLEVGNAIREQYFIVISESKQDVELALDDYADLTSKHMLGTLKNGERGPKSTVTIDGHPAIQYEVKGSVDKTPVVYLQTTVETPGGFHQLLMWTLPSKREIAWPVFKEVLDSVKVEDPKTGESS
ncbi:hypothetical protein [Luteolibacter sp. LG18]|uniref:hypothetical protein n=1 Tax=Luteolibacter sp. LG18 TaxID=2819286 RepID=UPI002B2BE724|nr:hypothetical protein llg_38330 [Luteolibacter sp. LG18]